MKSCIWIMAASMLICGISSLSAIADDLNYCLSARESVTPSAPIISEAMAGYTGRLRVYVVEPTSYRWLDYNSRNYNFAFLSYAIDTVVTIPFQGTYTQTKIWDGVLAGYAEESVTDTNIMAIAVMFNGIPQQGYANPSAGNPFTAYYVDASAVAEPGQTGTNVVSAGYTHSVFLEEATATW